MLKLQKRSFSLICNPVFFNRHSRGYQPSFFVRTNHLRNKFVLQYHKTLKPQHSFKAFGWNRPSLYVENVFSHCKLVLEIYELQKQNLKRQFCSFDGTFQRLLQPFLSKKLFQLGIILLESKHDRNTIQYNCNKADNILQSAYGTLAFFSLITVKRCSELAINSQQAVFLSEILATASYTP